MKEETRAGRSNSNWAWEVMGIQEIEEMCVEVTWLHNYSLSLSLLLFLFEFLYAMVSFRFHIVLCTENVLY